MELNKLPLNLIPIASERVFMRQEMITMMVMVITMTVITITVITLMLIKNSHLHRLRTLLS